MSNFLSIQGVRKIMEVLKTYTEENLVWEKEQNMLFFIFSWQMPNIILAYYA